MDLGDVSVVGNKPYRELDCGHFLEGQTCPLDLTKTIALQNVKDVTGQVLII